MVIVFPKPDIEGIFGIDGFGKSRAIGIHILDVCIVLFFELENLNITHAHTRDLQKPEIRQTPASYL